MTEHARGWGILGPEGLMSTTWATKQRVIVYLTGYASPSRERGLELRNLSRRGYRIVRVRIETEER